MFFGFVFRFVSPQRSANKALSLQSPHSCRLSGIKPAICWCGWHCCSDLVLGFGLVNLGTIWLNVLWHSSVPRCLEKVFDAVFPLVFSSQVRRHRLGLCQLSQAGLSQRGLRRRVLLPLQTGMAPQPDLRFGPPAEGAVPAHPQQPLAQLHAGARTWWGLSTVSQHHIKQTLK